MTFNVSVGLTAIQSAVSTRLSGWTDAVAASVLGQVQNLPHWDHAGVQPPQSLSDLAHPRTAFSLLLNPNFAHSVCRIIGVDARTIIGRETRSRYLLPNLREPAVEMTLTDHLHSVPASRIVFLLQKYPNVRLFIARENRPEARVPASLISILLMAVKEGENVAFRAEGEGAADVLRQLQQFNAGEWFKGERLRSRVKIRDLQGTDLREIVPQILEAMRVFDTPELAAIYHARSRRFVVSHILSTHKEIAKVAGFEDPDSYHRLNFDAYKGYVRACFAPGEEKVEKAGRDELCEWLRGLLLEMRSGQ